MKANRGFTLLELIAVLIVVSIFSYFVAIKYYQSDDSVFVARQQLITAFQHARMLSLAQSTSDVEFRVVVSSNSIAVQKNTSDLVFSSLTYPQNLPQNTGVIQGIGVFYFDRNGNSSTETFTVSNGINNKVVTLLSSGYVY